MFKKAALYSQMSGYVISNQYFILKVGKKAIGLKTVFSTFLIFAVS